MIAAASIQGFLAGHDLVSLIAAAAAFGLVSALWCLGVLLWANARASAEKKIRARLEDKREQPSAHTLRLWRDGKETALTVPGRAPGPSLLDRIEQIRKDAGWSMPMHSIVLLLSAIILGAGGLVLLATGSMVSAFGLGAIILVVVWILANKRAARNAALFERQLVDGLELSARALRAGHPLLGSFELIADEVPAPVGALFADICQQQSLGMSLEDAVRDAALLSRNADMKLFSASLAINMRSGGNLADVVEGIAKVIRQRMRLIWRFRVLTAQTQMSKRILLAMPIIIFGVLQLIDASYMRKLFVTPIGNVLLGIAVLMLCLGWVMMNKMAALEM